LWERRLFCGWHAKGANKRWTPPLHPLPNARENFVEALLGCARDATSRFTLFSCMLQTNMIVSQATTNIRAI